MAKFWVWGVRNPCVLIAGLTTMAWLTGVTDWSLSMLAVTVMGFAANIANHLARRAHARASTGRKGAIPLAETRKAYLDRAA